MSILIQYDFFKTEEESRLEAIEERGFETFKRVENVRKGMYARLNKLEKENNELKERLEIIERNICYG